MKNKDFSKTTKVILIVCLIIFTIALAYREHKLEVGHTVG